MQRLSVLALSLLLASLACTGCDMAAFAAGSTIKVFDRASPALQRYRDPELAEAAIPAGISQFEGVLMVQPQDATLRLLLTRAYGGYAFGFLENHLERAELAEHDEMADHFRHRASIAYLRGKVVAFEMMNIWHHEDGGVEGHEHGPIDAWKAYLTRFNDRSQAPILFWAAYNWIRYISLNRDDMDAVADLPYVTAMVEYVNTLDNTYYNYAPQAMLAGIHGSTSEQMGGHPAQAKEEMDRVIALTQRHNFMYLVIEAHIIAVALQDRALYRSLLEEVINGNVDIDPDQRLSNVLAQHRAIRYLSQIDDLFEPDPNDHGGEAVPAGEDDVEEDGQTTQNAPPATPPATPPAPATPPTPATPPPATPPATPPTAATPPAHPPRPHGPPAPGATAPPAHPTGGSPANAANPY